MAPGRALPIHWGTFRLSYEARDTPPLMLSAILRCAGYDPSRFASTRPGVPVDVPSVVQRQPGGSEARIDECLRTRAVRALH